LGFTESSEAGWPLQKTSNPDASRRVPPGTCFPFFDRTNRHRMRTMLSDAEDTVRRVWREGVGRVVHDATRVFTLDH
jgi:hypothetical protein